MVSCGEDDNPEASPFNTEYLKGKWDLKGVDYRRKNQTLMEGFDLSKFYIGAGKDFDAVIVFEDTDYNSIGSYKVDAKTKKESRKIGDPKIIDESTGNEELEFSSLFGRGTFSVSGITLSLINPKDTTMGQLVKLTSDTLLFTTNVTTSEQLTAGESSSSSIDVEYFFTK